MAEYIPIPDDEILPEKPVTSILMNKLRDNPEAVWSGAADAPRIQAGGIGDGQVGPQHFNNTTGNVTVNLEAWTRYATPGGSWAFNNVFSQGSGGEGSSVRMLDNISGTNNGAYFSANRNAAGVNYTVTWNYFQDPTAFAVAWLFEIKEKITGLDLGRWIAQDHPAFGQPNLADFSQPFGHYDPLLHDIFIINLDAFQWEAANLAQIPIMAGGYLTPALYLSGLYDVNYFAEKREFFASFDSLYSINYGVSELWPEIPVPIAVGNKYLNKGKLVTVQMPQPPVFEVVSLVTL